MTAISLLIAFLPTAIRFAHGGNLHLSALTMVGNWRQDMFGLIILVSFFQQCVVAISAAACLAFFSLVATIYDYTLNKDQYFPPD